MTADSEKDVQAFSSKASIEDNLRKVYQEVLDEKIPDRFTQLLQELRNAQSKGGTPAAKKEGPQ